ncbi:MAG TPA: HAD family hydrolase [Candidatus Eremiobacteraceae bacterium]|jgi:HAD superfamily hydrolase (TIGR01509 family)
MTRRKLRTMLVDIDGTLVYSNFAHAAAWSSALKIHGFDIEPEVVRPRIGMGADKLLAGLHAELRPNTALARTIDRDRQKIFLGEYLPGILPTPGARSLIESLHARGVKIVVASSASDDERNALLDVAQVKEFVEQPSAKPVRSKPDPDIVVAALESAGTPATGACMIGDTPYDIDAATRAGVRIIAVRCGGWDERSLSQASEVYASPAEALDHIPDWAGV